MKRKAEPLSIITVLFLLILCTQMVNLTEANQPLIISFEEAIEAANTSNFNGQSWNEATLIIEFHEGDLFVDNSGVSGFLMWLAPNSTVYKAKYPTGIILEDIGYVQKESNWNSSDGYYIWKLSYPDGGQYWVLANDGTIFLNNLTRTESLPPPTIISQEIFFGIVAVLLVVFDVSLIFIMQKRKRIETRIVKLFDYWTFY